MRAVQCITQKVVQMPVKFEFIISDADAENLIDILNDAVNFARAKAQHCGILFAESGNQLDAANYRWYEGHSEYLNDLKNKIAGSSSRTAKSHLMVEKGFFLGNESICEPGKNPNLEKCGRSAVKYLNGWFLYDGDGLEVAYKRSYDEAELWCLHAILPKNKINCD